MNTCTLKFEATAFRENDDNELESLSASISVPVENDDEVIGNMLGEEKLIVHAVAALYNLISDLRPNWLLRVQDAKNQRYFQARVFCSASYAGICWRKRNCQSFF